MKYKKVKKILGNGTSEQYYSDPVDESTKYNGKYYPNKQKITFTKPLDISGEFTRPQSTDEKLAELVRLADVGKAINETGFNRDLSGDAYFADVMRGNYITSTGGQGQAAPRVTQAPAFQPPIPPEKLNLLERGMRLKEAGGAEQIKASQAKRELENKRFNEMKMQWDQSLAFKKENQRQANILSYKKLKQGDRALTLEQKRFLDTFKQNNRKIDILSDQFEKEFGFNKEKFRKEYGLEKQRFNEKVKVDEANIANNQQRLNLEEYKLRKTLETGKYNKARILIKDGISNGKTEDQMLDLVDIMKKEKLIDNSDAKVMKRILHEPTRWERFKNWILGD